MLRPTVSRPVCLSVKRSSWVQDQNFLLPDSCGFGDVGRPLWWEDESVIYTCCGIRQRSHSRVRVLRDSWSYFTAPVSRLRPTWRARSPYLLVYPPGTGWPSYTLRHWVPFSSPPTTSRATVEVFQPVSTRDGFVPNSSLSNYQSSSYLTGNILRLRYKAQPINAV
jgi:hypothetical protein